MEGSQDSLCVYKGQDVCYHNAQLLGGVIFDLAKTDANDGVHGQSMAAAVIQGGWATPQQMYQGAFDCAASGRFGQAMVDIGPDSRLDLSCLSQMDECYLGGNTLRHSVGERWMSDWGLPGLGQSKERIRQASSLNSMFSDKIMRS